MKRMWVGEACLAIGALLASNVVGIAQLLDGPPAGKESDTAKIVFGSNLLSDPHSGPSIIGFAKKPF